MMRILVATDGSDPAERAVELGARLARDLKAHLKIVHVVTGRDVPSEQLNDYALREHANSAEVLNAFSEEKLRIARQRAQAAGIPDVEAESRSESQPGEIAETIVDIARRETADMIILGKRGLGRLSGLILGSVSQKVVSVAPCAVLVVP